MTTSPTVTAYSLLPFLTPPQIKSVVIGKPGLGELEITKYWGLTEDEQVFIRQNSVDFDTSRLAISIATSIASKLESTTLAVANALLRSDFDFFKEHLEELFTYKDKAKDLEEKREIVLVTAVVKFRLLSEWTIEDSLNPSQIPPQLLSLLTEFALNERDGWEDEEYPAEQKEKDKSQLETLVRQLLEEEEEISTEKTSEIKSLIRQLLGQDGQDSPVVQTVIAHAETESPDVKTPTTFDSDNETPVVKIPATLDSDNETPD